MTNKWSRLEAPPPPLFMGDKERNFQKQITDELIERVIGQQILYYPIDLNATRFHPLYGEAIEKTFLPPVHVYALINFEAKDTDTTNYGIDRLTTITIHFHKRRLVEDQNLYVREGDFVAYGANFYEIVSINEPRELFGQTATKVEISAKCIKARSDLFNSD